MESDMPQLRETELYRALTQTFPDFRTRQQKVLDVESLAKAIGMTEEGLYKWLRAGRILSAKGVEKLCQLANTPENVAALDRRGRTPPSKQDLARFMLA
jgi:transcriptional regulator with XRE-family HTH domain